jgi:hypothetical protein
MEKKKIEQRGQFHSPAMCVTYVGTAPRKLYRRAKVANYTVLLVAVVHRLQHFVQAAGTVAESEKLPQRHGVPVIGAAREQQRV